MKINRFLGMAALAVLIVGAMGVFSMRSFAQTPEPAAPGQATEAPDAETADDAAVNPNAPAGQQPAVEPTEAADSQEPANGQQQSEATGAENDHAGEQAPAYTSSITVDPATTQGLSEADEEAALAKLAKITADEANTAALAANAGATVTKTALEAKGASLVYGVELSTGVEVVVDAGNGAILATETGDNH